MITLNFDEVLERTYNAKKGVDVRYGLGQGFEYCKQFADEAQGYATNAKASEKKATDAVAGIEQTKTDAVQAVQNAQSTATTAVTTKQTEAVQAVGTAQTGAVKAVDDERDAALQQVESSTATAKGYAEIAASASNAAGNAATAAGGYASNAKSSATAASGSASAAAESESNAASSAQSANTDADRAEAAAELAGTRANTDKTLKTENAPADAKAVGDIILDRTKETPQPIFYSKAEVEAKIKEILAKQQSEDYAKIKFWVSPDPTSPASIVGGTWERIKDRFILAAGDTYAAGSTGGKATHTLTSAEIPTINGSVLVANNPEIRAVCWDIDPKNAIGYSVSISDGKGSAQQYLTANYINNNQAPVSIIPPYAAFYVWKRIA